MDGQILPDASGETGRIQIASDFGSWQYYWGSCGMPFKEFLICLNIGYAANKFGEDKWFNLSNTIECLKQQIDEFTLYDTDADEHKKELLAELTLLTEETSTRGEFERLMWKSPKLLDMCDNIPPICTAISPAFRKFWETLWKAFVGELKNEADIEVKF